ncbi:Na+/H+ antiporter subunit B [Halomonas elongata]|uniref:Mrp-type sodium/proton antiporter system subunit B n=1 Tax=Halomonas elongata (strain ATCC 33173 / DSM 2581 / NBRC 15536 / NCIMB 2198 / 1H9) TaxID=768066 RepID=E1V717_HALED|nr:Na+/H+ antiporter subunit B [Halomonas elongata]MDL4863313.1 Na+/H+ antiporter subunit B [Halomonas elongata]RAW09042.1 Na(+)/H(+) antiporter subunit B [Halomonas elongata]WBF17144.1 Na+/H+ antiporter subunit B [Halomonas elongata]WPU45978.1 Na+/H+ antiporter subunit B [Halomonas elongata DSM 2581]WVI70797.1 Na+/H+ antiporter subunit B [Halomonas elongata]
MVRSGTLILSVAARLLLPLQLLFSVFLLLRGHDEPGGGFIAGLVASGAFTLYFFAYGRGALSEMLKVSPRDMVAMGLLLGVLSTLPAWWAGEPFFTAQWWTLPVIGIKVSTPLIFDIGVYLAVVGSVLTAITALVDTDADESQD